MSTETASRVDESVLELLQEELDEPVPCEHSEHPELPEFHDGNGVWYLWVEHNCGWVKGLRVYCDKYMQIATSGKATFICRGCLKTRIPFEEIYTIKGKR